MTTQTAPIVCGTDFSDSAAGAATVAALVAKKLNAPLKLVFARLPMAMGSPSDADRAIENSFRKQLDCEVQRLGIHGVEVEGILCQGRSPCDALVELVAENEARLLVVAWHGMNSGRRIGSFSERLVQLSPVPTLVIQKAALFISWLENDLPLKTFVGFDFSVSSEHALRWVRALQEIGPCRITAAYIDQPAKEEDRLGLPGSLLSGRNVPEVQEILERDLRDKVAGILGNNKSNIIVEGDWGSGSHELVRLAREHHADLIVVGTHQRHGLNKLRKGSISQDVLQEAPASIACVPVPAAGAAPVSSRIHRFKRVMAAIDLNEPPGLAAAHAYSIVAPGGEVLLINNIIPFKPNSFIRDYLSSDLPPKNMGNLERLLRRHAPEEARELNITTSTRITEKDNTAEAICQAAEQFNADAICIGSHTRPGFTAKMLGSVALSVLQKSRRPVLLVWPPNKE